MIHQLYHHPDIYEIHVDLPNNPLQYLNSYVVKGKTRNLVIDTGFNRPECRQALCEGLRELDIELEKTDLFLTHLHADHTGLVGLFADAGCPVYMHPLDYDYLKASETGSTWRFTEENFMREGMPEEDIKNQFSNQARKYSPKINFPLHPVVDGDVVHLADEDFHIIHTPGHTMGICCLYLPKEEIFFTTDHILFDISPNIQVWPGMKDSLAQYLKSLDKVKDLPVKLALPGHRHNRTSIAERIDELKDHHAKRLEEILTIVAERPNTTAFTIAQHMTWSMRGKKWPEFPPTQKWFAMGEALAHIEYLVNTGKLSRTEQDGLRRYAVVSDKVTHPFSIVAIKDTYHPYANHFLLYRDHKWDCNFFLNYRTQPTEEENIAFIKAKLSQELHVPVNYLSVKKVGQVVQEKYAVKEDRKKVYDHSYYEAQLTTFPKELQSRTFIIDGKEFIWMTLDEMKNDRDIQAKNLDVVNQVSNMIP